MNGNEDSASPLPNLKGTLDLAEYHLLDDEKYTIKVRDDWAKKFEQYFR